jgi:hypothetical protein
LPFRSIVFEFWQSLLTTVRAEGCVERAVERNAVGSAKTESILHAHAEGQRRRCDQVMQTPFTGTLLSVNPWEARLLR